MAKETAFFSLVNDAIEYEVAAIRGVGVTAEEMNALKRHVDKQTKAAEILQKVKLLFRDDESSYERIYLSPKIVNRKLHDFYSGSPEIHKRERSLIERAHGLVVTGKSL